MGKLRMQSKISDVLESLVSDRSNSLAGSITHLPNYPLTKSVDVSIAAGFFAGAQSFLHFGDSGPVILKQGFDPLSFGLHLQQRLFEIEIHRKIVSELK